MLQTFLQIVKCLTKGREPAPCTVFGLLFWQKTTPGSIQGMEKGLYHQDPSNSQNRLSWANRPRFLRANPWRYRSADVKPAVVPAGLTALQTLCLQAPAQPTAQSSSPKASDRDGWDLGMSRALDASPLTCSNCAAKGFREL